MTVKDKLKRTKKDKLKRTKAQQAAVALIIKTANALIEQVDYGAEYRCSQPFTMFVTYFHVERWRWTDPYSSIPGEGYYKGVDGVKRPIKIGSSLYASLSNTIKLEKGK